ncbi:PolC-type DNA polymerase III [uncultured Psychroserpens sp.]|uniref:3'-5' exonuclease n=1 Tax=uncultured Psychroserpens sp. TaxID=255436 RepID=UPI002626FA42|nr:3'-5' exonuclease [uncultured Psychroserpens sp.]
MSWFKRQTYPEFYTNYLESFKGKSNTLETIRFVVFDTETTGLNPKSDRILSIGTVAVTNFQIDVADSLELYVKQEQFNAKTVEIHGLLKEGLITKTEETQAIQQFLAHIENAVLVAHHIAFDVAMINEALKRMNLPKLKNKVVDTGTLYKKTKYLKDETHYSLDELCATFNITMHDRHTASGDAYLTAVLFLKLTALLRQKKSRLSLRDLTGWF